MNFIAHYYLDRDHPSPYFQLGTFFPDLLRFSHPSIKAHKIDSAGGVHSKALHKGIRKHLATDKHFHQSTFFIEKSKHLQELLVKQRFREKGIRVSFIAHIATEILFDRILLLDQPAIGPAFYANLHSIEHEHVHQLLDPQPAFQATKFDEHFVRFRTNQWLLSYVETERVFFALNKVCERIGTPGFAKEDFSAFEDCLLSTESISKPALHSFLEDMKAVQLS